MIYKKKLHYNNIVQDFHFLFAIPNAQLMIVLTFFQQLIIGKQNDFIKSKKTIRNSYFRSAIEKFITGSIKSMNILQLSLNGHINVTIKCILMFRYYNNF